MDRIATLIALGFGSGLLRPAPGTWGSLAAVLLGYGAFLAAGPIAVAVAAALACVIGIWAAERYGQITGTSDASQVVIDEFAGQWIALLPVVYVAPDQWLCWAASFALFRLFDVLKPGPIGILDRRLKGGLGVMADDILAGALSAVLLGIGLTYVA
ncbi:MAG: phosphatidylglycerophosphatase A [Pseudomonadota bacterium]